MKWFDPLERGCRDEQDLPPLFTEQLQVYVVALVWVVALIFIFSTQGCADRSNDPGRPAPQIMSDLVIGQPTKLSASSYHVVNRLIFARGSRLLTQGADLRIEANEIISDDGVIESFSADSVALPGKTGLPGGRITLTAKNGRGNLFIYGRGQSGGPGLPGMVGFAGTAGAAGRNAYGTHAPVDVVCDCGNIAYDLREKFKLGKLLEAFFAKQQFFIQRARHRCIQEPGNGLSGERGGIGTTGSNGGRGGDSARVFVDLENPVSLQIKAYLNPGQGGAGGSGGQGGDGGRGGAPGDHNLDYFGNCQAAAQGSIGPVGESGKSGQAGIAGNTLSMCLKLGAATVGDCEKVNNQKEGNQ